MSQIDLHADTTRPERRIRDMLDRSEIVGLIGRSLMCIDEGRFTDLRAIYTEDASASAPGGHARGRDAIIAQVSRNHVPEIRSQHIVGDAIVDLDDEKAKVRANVFAAFASSATDHASPLGPPVQCTFGTVYRYAAVRTPEGWRLSAVEITPLWVTGSTDGLVRKAD